MSVRRASVSQARGALSALAVAAALAVGSCGGDSEGTPALSADDPGEGGTLSWALAAPVTEVEPLTAETPGEQLVSRQIHEPLVASLAGPFGDTRRRPGLARTARPSADGTVWRLRLRREVRFQDSVRFNAGAVLANAERWRTVAEGRALLPDLLAVDAPRPDLVRFFLSAPDAAFDARLADPRLGIVSPRALLPRSGTGAAVRRTSATGTGPFELRERTSESLLLARNVAWWGTVKRLGPALDQLEFLVVPAARERAGLLAEGRVQAASRLGPAQAREVRRNPLLTVLPFPGSGGLGLVRSVRGVDSAREVPSLSGAWLTTIRTAE